MVTVLRSSFVPLLLVFLLPLVQAGSTNSSSTLGGQASSSGGHSSSAHPPWYNHEYEYNYIEALILIVLVIIALAWEHLWHHLSHESSHSYRYGHLHDVITNDEKNEHNDSHGDMKHPRLYKTLVNRAGGEFMTLGVLAFITFLFNNAGGFDLMAKMKQDDSVPMPSTASDWLHLVEAVHVKLFSGMLLYFFLIASTVRSSVCKIKLWESCRLRRTQIADVGAGRGGFSHMMKADPDLEEHVLWRNYFIERVVLWQGRRPGLYHETLGLLDIENDQDAPESLRKALGERLSFAAYLAINVAEGICDSIEVHQETWMMLIALFGLFAVLHRYAKVSVTEVTIVFVILTLFLMLLTASMVRREKKKIVTWMDNVVEKRRQKLEKPSPSMIGEISESPDRLITPRTISTKFGVNVKNLSRHQHTYLMRSLTMMFFIVSYVFAGVLMDFHGWEEYPEKTLLGVCLFSIVYIFLTVLMRTLVPTFLALTSLPPYVDESNIQHLFTLLLDDHRISAPVSSGENDAETSAVISHRVARTDSEMCRTHTLARKFDELSDSTRNQMKTFEEKLNELAVENAFLRAHLEKIAPPDEPREVRQI